MTAYLRCSTLSMGGLSLSLENELGQPQDAQYVVWTVSSGFNGKQISGLRMKAVRKGVGQYYAPWYADDPTGAYEITWEYQRDVDFPIEKKTERFFIMDLDDPTCKSGHIHGLPPPGGYVFEPGARISGNEIVLRVVDSIGCQKDVSNVVWSIECSKGFTVWPETSAVRLSTGLYGVDWTVSVQGGLYFVRWKWSEFPGGPLTSFADSFQVVDPKNPRVGVVSVGL
jgi:hypothetical protein